MEQYPKARLTKNIPVAFFLVLAIFFLQNSCVTKQKRSPTNVLYVGAGQEYETIQDAVDVAEAGDTILVADGNYAGFLVSTSGTISKPITFKGKGNNVVINRDAWTGDGISLWDVSNVVIDGFRIQDVSGRCIAARKASPADPMRNITIQNIDCRRSGLDGFYLSQLNSSLIDSNYISATGLKDAPGGRAAHGIYLANAGSKNTKLRNNIITPDPDHPNYSGCLHINGDKSVGGNGIISGLLIENNKFIGCYRNGINMDGIQDSVIRNNLIYDGGRHALRGYQIDGAQGPKNLQIYNNTFIVPAEVVAWAVKLTEDSGGHTIFNNIFLKEGSSGGSVCVSDYKFLSDRNITVDRMSIDGENTVIDAPVWKGLTGQDVNSHISSSDALFVNPSRADYHLKSGSPAINAGRASLNSIDAASSDLEGKTRPQGSAFDIGAYEYDESACETASPSAQNDLRIGK
jgi:hypothetical protein